MADLDYDRCDICNANAMCGEWADGDESMSMLWLATYPI